MEDFAIYPLEPLKDALYTCFVRRYHVSVVRSRRIAFLATAVAAALFAAGVVLWLIPYSLLIVWIPDEATPAGVEGFALSLLIIAFVIEAVGSRVARKALVNIPSVSKIQSAAEELATSRACFGGGYWHWFRALVDIIVHLKQAKIHQYLNEIGTVPDDWPHASFLRLVREAFPE